MTNSSPSILTTMKHNIFDARQPHLIFEYNHYIFFVQYWLATPPSWFHGNKLSRKPSIHHISIASYGYYIIVMLKKF